MLWSLEGGEINGLDRIDDTELLANGCDSPSAGGRTGADNVNRGHAFEA